MVATDDRKAERVLADRVPLRSTLDLVKAWAAHGSVDQATLRAAVIDLRDRGSYVPRRAHPLRAWWDAVVGPP